jgi:hypothetical protein
VARDEPHVSFGGILAVELFLEILRKSILEHNPIFGQRFIFGNKDLILECKQHVERKQHAEKEGKVACRRKMWRAGKQS